MFTGIIEDIGVIRAIYRSAVESKMMISSSKICSDISLGDSIAINGICLTVSAFHDDTFMVDVMNETWRRTSLALLRVGGKVNLERAVSLQGRFGGHIISGHIDGTGKIIRIRRDGNAFWYDIQCDRQILDDIIVKGSVALDGISLTVAFMGKEHFAVSLIPHTLKETILFTKKEQDLVNIETDMIGKYVKKWLSREKSMPITSEFLMKHNF